MPFRAPSLRCLAAERGSGAAQTLALGLLAFAILDAAGLLGAMAYRGDQIPDPATAAPPPAVGQGETVDVLLMRCEENGAAIEGSAVKARADGVHVNITEANGSQEVFFQSGGRVLGFDLQGAGGSFELPLPPGDWNGSCVPNGSPLPAEDAGAKFTVFDPDEHFVLSQPTCPAQGCCELTGTLNEGFVRDQEVVLRTALAGKGIADDDVIERAAYPESALRGYPATPSVFGVERAGEVVARVEVLHDDGRWSYLMLGCPTL